MVSTQMLNGLCEDVKHIKIQLQRTEEILQGIQSTSTKMSSHIDFVEKHISWVTRITDVLLPRITDVLISKPRKKTTEESTTDAFVDHFDRIL